jgi:lipopolysaccharide/colanic/teichoic acid biosynthesis glycosyltransferase
VSETGQGTTTATRSHGCYRIVKRAADIVCSLLALIVLAIPLAIICMVIRHDSAGHAIYRQERVGRYGKPLRIFKLRTMVSDANNLEKYLSPAQMRRFDTEHKVDDDPRITHVGSWLRRTSIDEVPQFLNVLLGQMSVVGPRPVEPDELLNYGDDVDEFLSAEPGITGYWQVFARNDADYKSGKRQEMELYYIRNVSFKLDVSIFAKTFSAIVNKTGQ